MELLHLRGDRTFAQKLRTMLQADGHELRGADAWGDLFNQLSAGPYAMAILLLKQPTATDEANCRRLAAETQNSMEIHLITDDQAMVIRLQAAALGVFKWAPLNTNPDLLHEPIGLVLARATLATHPVASEEIAAGIHLHRTTARWSVRRDDMGIETPLTPQETGILEAVLEAHGQPVSKAELARCAGRTKPLGQPSLYAAISHLREKLEADPQDPRHLLTVYRFGYRWQW